MISGATLPPRAVTINCGREKFKVISGDFPWGGAQLHDIGPCAQQKTQAGGFYEPHDVCGVQTSSWPLLAIRTERNQRCSSAKPEERSSWDQWWSPASNRNKLKWESDHCDESETWLMSSGLVQHRKGNCPDPPHLWDGLQNQKEFTKMGIF